MKYIIITILMASIFFNCGEDVTGIHEYQELEIDMVEYCRDKLSGYYYIGPTNYNQAELYLLSENGLFWIQVFLIFAPGKGIQFVCPDGLTYKLKWN